mgnify:CR=1 FL=1
MNKMELIDAIAAKQGTLSADARAYIGNVIADALKIIGDELVSGGKVTLIGFGTFEVKECAAREGRNPRTGEVILLEAHKRVLFHTGRTLKNKVKG